MLAVEIPPTRMDNYELVTQVGTPIFPLEDSDSRALPWPGDVMAVSSFFSAPSHLAGVIVQKMNEFSAFAVDLFGGLDHRMYWSPYGEFEMPGAAPLYFESEEKFHRLMHIKGCVDPKGMFRNAMSIPVPAVLPKGCDGKASRDENEKKLKKEKGKAERAREARDTEFMADDRSRNPLLRPATVPM